MQQKLIDLCTQYLAAGNASEERWRPLKGSNILFYQTILSVVKTIDEYIPSRYSRWWQSWGTGNCTCWQALAE